MKSNIIKIFVCIICLLAFGPAFSGKVDASSPDIVGRIVDPNGVGQAGVWVQFIDSRGDWRWIQSEWHSEPWLMGRFYFQHYNPNAPGGSDHFYESFWQQANASIDTNNDGVNDNFQALSTEERCDQYGNNCGLNYDNGFGCGEIPLGFRFALPYGWNGTFSTETNDSDYACSTTSNYCRFQNEYQDSGEICKPYGGSPCYTVPFYKVTSGLTNDFNNSRGEINIGTFVFTPTVNGSCGTTYNTCTAGNPGGGSDMGTYYYWGCYGTNGGSTAYCTETKAPVCDPNTGNACNRNACGGTGTILCNGSCSASAPACTPVNGSCGAIPTHYICDPVTTISTNNAENSTTYTWTCPGSNGGSDASCSEAKPCPYIKTTGGDVHSNTGININTCSPP